VYILSGYPMLIGLAVLGLALAAGFLSSPSLGPSSSKGARPLPIGEPPTTAPIAPVRSIRNRKPDGLLQALSLTDPAKPRLQLIQGE
jgi:hypothetical protein